MKEKKQGFLKRTLAVLLSVFMIVSGLPGYVEEVSAEDCNHSYGSYTPPNATRTPATCTSPAKDPEYCNHCGKLMGYKDVGQALGHQMEWVVGKEASCTEDGWRIYKCTRSGCTYTQGSAQVISQTGHDWEYKYDAVVQTCTVDGYDHYVCKKCSASYDKNIGKKAHTNAWVVKKEASCSEEGYKNYECTVCHGNVTDSQTISKTPHNYKFQKTIKKATCTEKGTDRYVCTECNAVDDRSTDKIGHTMGWVTKKAASCSEEGYKNYECTVCHGNVTDSQTISKTPHNYKFQKTVKKATCTANGTDRYVCTVCNAVDDRSTDKSGHSMGWVTKKAASCSEEGYKNYECTVCHGNVTNSQTISKTPHNYQFQKTVKKATCTAKGTDRYVCTVCNAIDDRSTEKTGHTMGWVTKKAASCTQEGYKNYECTVCHGNVTDSQTISKTPHSMVKQKTIAAASCSSAGKDLYKCSVCGATEERATSKTAHTMGWVTKKEPTCKETGYRNYECTVCHGNVTDSQTIDKIPDHTWNRSEATCTEAVKCTVCGTIKIPAKGHTMGWVTKKAASCTQEGYKNYECTVCHGNVTNSQTIQKTPHNPDRASASCTVAVKCKDCGTVITPAKGHTMGWVIKKDASCTQEGYKNYECAVCHENATNSQTIEKTPHSFVKQKTITAATCTSYGKDLYKCSKCGATEERTTAKLAHTMGWVIKKEATCTEEGYKNYECTVCHGNATNSQTIKKVPHNWDRTSATCTEEQVCLDCGYVGQTLKEHSWEIDSSKSVKATTEKEGKEVKVCSVCGKQETTILPRLEESSTVEDETESTSETSEIEDEPTIDETESSTSESESATTPQLASDPKTLIFTAVADSKTLKLLNLNKDSSVRVSLSGTSGNWIKVGRSGSEYTIRVLENTSGAVRKGVITFIDTSTDRSVDVEVQQSSSEGYIVKFNVNGGRGQKYLPSKTVVPNTPMKGILPDKVDAPAFKMFDGWYTAPKGGVKITENSVAPNVKGLELFAQYVDRTYYIEYDGNGAESGSMARTSAVCNHNIDLRENNFKKTGYTLSGWNTKADGSGKTIAAYNGKAYNLVGAYAEPESTVILYAQWEPGIPVKVTYDVNGGNDPENIIGSKTFKTVNVGERYGALPRGLTHPNNLVFDAWVLPDDTPGDLNDNPVVSDNTIVTMTTDHRLIARWKVSTYTLHFAGNGAKEGEMPDWPVNHGEKITLPACTYDGGVGFDCWGTEPSGDGTGQYYQAETTIDPLVVNQNQTEFTLYAIWKKTNIVIEYYDGFKTDKLLYKTKPGEVGHKYNPYAKAPEVDGLTFVGWSTKKPITYPVNYPDKDIYMRPNEPIVIDSDNYNKGIRVYAVYELADSNGFTVIYNLNGGTDGPEAEVFDGNAKTFPISSVEPNKPRFDFDGWSTDPQGRRRVKDTVGKPAGGDYIVLYAQWTAGKSYIALYMGYENIVESRSVTANDPYIMLEEPGRPYYTFTGWKEENSKEIFKAGDELYVPEEGLVLYAQWERNQYIIEYVDDKTKKVLATEKLYSSDHLVYEPKQLVGQNFTGWLNEDDLTFIEANAEVSDFVNPYIASRKYRLYTQYEDPIDLSRNQVVFYNLNHPSATRGPAEPTFVDMQTGEFTVSIARPKCDTADFLGWSSTPGGEVEYDPGKTYDFSETGSAWKLYLYGCWSSKYTCILDTNECPGTSIPYFEIHALPGETIDLAEYTNRIVTKNASYSVDGWGFSKTSPNYGKDGSFTVPDRDVTLYAIWHDNEYVVKFCDGVTGRELARFTKKHGESFKAPDVALVVSGHGFTGWSTIMDYTAEPMYQKDERITVTEAMTLYSTYEYSKEVDGMFVIDYVTGADGGPGTKNYEPGNVTISDYVPTRDGYTFLGWDMSRPNYQNVLCVDFPVGKTNTYKGVAGERITLYAVWQEACSNSLLYQLEEIYGVGAFDRDNFYKAYESTDWERINDQAYYVIRTKDRCNSQLGHALSSTAMIMEYKNGAWHLNAYGTNEGLWESLRLDILTSSTNSEAETIDFVMSIVDTGAEIGFDAVSVYCPAVGGVVKGIHYLNKLSELMNARDEYEYLDEFFKEEAVKMGFEIAVDEISGKVLGEVVKNVVKSDKMPKVIGEGLVKLSATAAGSLFDDLSSSEELDPYGAYDTAFGLFKERIRKQKFSVNIVNNMPKYINIIYDNVFSR